MINLWFFGNRAPDHKPPVVRESLKFKKQFRVTH